MPLLGYAVLLGHVDCVRVLLECGVDVNEVFDGGRLRTACDAADYFLRTAGARRERIPKALQILALIRDAGGKNFPDL